MSNTCAANPSATKQIPSKQQSTCPSASPSCLCVLEFLVFLFLVFLVFLVMVDFLVFHVFLLVLFLRTSWLYPTFRSIRARQRIGPRTLHVNQDQLLCITQLARWTKPQKAPAQPRQHALHCQAFAWMAWLAYAGEGHLPRGGMDDMVNRWHLPAPWAT